MARRTLAARRDGGPAAAAIEYAQRAKEAFELIANSERTVSASDLELVLKELGIHRTKPNVEAHLRALGVRDGPTSFESGPFFTLRDEQRLLTHAGVA